MTTRLKIFASAGALCLLFVTAVWAAAAGAGDVPAANPGTGTGAGMEAAGTKAVAMKQPDPAESAAEDAAEAAREQAGRDLIEGAEPAGEESGMSTNLLKGLYRNWVSTTPDAGDPDLRTRLYGCGPRKIFEHAKSLAAKRRGWKIIDADVDTGILKVEAKTFLFRFVDDVIIRVNPAPGGGTQLDMESRSRVGIGDLGTNARRVSDFLKGLDEVARNNGEM
jgi:uncharacterized protein (DUF1499 family)